MAGNFKGMEGILVDKFGWEELTADSVWSFGPGDIGSNMLVDYSLDFETNKQRLTAVKNSVVQGFQWATREGPLCEEPIKNVNFKLMGGTFDEQPIYRGGG
jgi:U5 small nuclear ribonucleoprotein component